MAQNLRINPKTRDYELLNGSPVESDRIHESTYLAVMIPAGQWLHGVSGQGSEIYRLVGAKRSVQNEKLFSTYAKEAIERQVVSTGGARSVSVYNVESTRDGTSNQIDVEPQTRDVSTLFNFKPV